MDYTITIETDRAASLVDDAETDAIMDGLDGYAPSIRASAYGYAEITLTIPAPNLARAIQTGTMLVEAIPGTALLALRVEGLVAGLAGYRAAMAADDVLISVTEAAHLLGVSPERVRQRIAAHTLPAKRIGKRWAIPRGAIDHAA